MRRGDESVVRTVNAAAQRLRGRPKKRWLGRLNEDMRTLNIAPEDAQARDRWRRTIQQADPAHIREQR